MFVDYAQLVGPYEYACIWVNIKSLDWSILNIFNSTLTAAANTAKYNFII